LTLLKAAGDDFPFIPLGDDDGLVETMAVTAFGYPRNKTVVDGERFPSLVVHSSTITSLRKIDGRLRSITISLPVQPRLNLLGFIGYGGPVIDGEGEVIGIQDNRIAIPVSEIKRFLEEPIISFEPEQLVEKESHKRLKFVVKIVSPVKPLNEPTVDVEFQSG